MKKTTRDNASINPDQTTETQTVSCDMESFQRLKELADYLKHNSPSRLLKAMKCRNSPQRCKQSKRRSKSDTMTKPTANKNRCDKREPKLHKKKVSDTESDWKRDSSRHGNSHDSKVIDHLSDPSDDSATSVCSEVHSDTDIAVVDRKETKNKDKTTRSRSLRSRKSKSGNTVESKPKKKTNSKELTVPVNTLSEDTDTEKYSKVKSVHNYNPSESVVSPAEKSARALISAFEEYQFHHSGTKITAEKFAESLSCMTPSFQSRQYTQSAMSPTLRKSEYVGARVNASMPTMPVTAQYPTNSLLHNNVAATQYNQPIQCAPAYEIGFTAASYQASHYAPFSTPSNRTFVCDNRNQTNRAFNNHGKVRTSQWNCAQRISSNYAAISKEHSIRPKIQTSNKYSTMSSNYNSSITSSNAENEKYGLIERFKTNLVVRIF